MRRIPPSAPARAAFALLLSVSLSALALSACGAPSGTVDLAGVTPRLPGDGSANVSDPVASARPVASASEPSAEPDPWAGRDDLIEAPAPQPPAPLEMPAIQRFTLPNGLPVVVVSKRDVPVVGVQLMVRAGNGAVPVDQSGLAQFVGAMLPKGTRTRNATAIAEAIESVGGRLAVEPGYEATLLSCQVLAAEQNTCLSIIADIAAQPTFPEDELGRVRRELLAGVRQRLDSASLLANAHFQNLLWGDEHPRGRPTSERSIEALSRADLVAWHKRWFVPQNAVLVIAGDVDPKGLRFRLGRAFNTWRRTGKAPAQPSVPAPAPDSPRIRLVDKPGQTQTHIRVGHMGIAHDAPDYFATLIFNHVLGSGGFSSRLMQVIRSQAGKTYGASSRFERSRQPGAFVVRTFSRNAEALATVELLLAEVARMQQEGPREAEVASAIANLAGQYAISMQSAADIAGALLAAELYGFDQSYVRDYPMKLAEVNKESATQAAAAHLRPDRVAIVLVGDARALEPQLESRGLPYDKVNYLTPVAAADRETAQVSAESAAAGKALLAKALAAKGGAKRLAAVRTMHIEATGVIHSGGQKIDATLERRFLAPDKLRLDLNLTVPGGTAELLTVLNGKRAWTKQPSGVVELPPEGVAELHKQVWRDQEFLLLHASEPGVQVQAAGQSNRDGKTYELLRVIRDDGVSVDILLDPKTHLIAGLTYDEAPGRSVFEQLDDYRTVEGIQIAHQRRTKSVEADLEVRIDSVAINEKLTSDVFEQPK
ncbi:M16 family metallopeptidase [Haliangium ochraceum]|uniref:Peptidase M16 domain protein n=1 Tax=Haliangium ochraceum (strain DSM 14365 / JCM 11303 / SMP-2) TaxID=502025 RepID=D0LGI6_HALO1|nr:pitrilysin family protein [Haliangium ochraceum]ACY12732.1 peptidase M16 domain protein [Haliangium ochraceum DSM 14365]